MGADHHFSDAWPRFEAGLAVNQPLLLNVAITCVNTKTKITFLLFGVPMKRYQRAIWHGHVEILRPQNFAPAAFGGC